MRIAVLVFGLWSVMLIGMQLYSVISGGQLTANEDFVAAGGIGVIIAFLFILGSAFAIGVPIASLVIFIIAALLGFIAGSQSEFWQLLVWAFVSMGLAVLSYFGIKEKKKKVALEHRTTNTTT